MLAAVEVFETELAPQQLFGVVCRRHMMTHSEEKPHVCEQCDASYKAVDALQRHQKCVKSSRFPSLIYCACQSSCVDTLIFFHLHRRKHGYVAANKKFPCPLCDRVFLSAWHLDEHIK